MEAEESEEINSSLRSHIEEVNDPKLDFMSNKSSTTEITRQLRTFDTCVGTPRSDFKFEFNTILTTNTIK